MGYFGRSFYPSARWKKNSSHCPSGGDERDRTDDPLLAKQVLSQLSYTPIFRDIFPIHLLRVIFWFGFASSRDF